jgi:hypothetical protein
MTPNHPHTDMAKIICEICAPARAEEGEQPNYLVEIDYLVNKTDEAGNRIPYLACPTCDGGVVRLALRNS